MSYSLIFLPMRLIQATQTPQNDKYLGLKTECTRNSPIV